MGLFDALEKVLDIEFAPDIDISSSISNIHLIKYEGGTKLEKEGESLKININELTPEERNELLQVPPDQLEVNGRVLEDDAENETAAIENGYQEYYDDILEYFEPILSDLYHEILEDALHLRASIEEQDLTRDEIHERKRDIAKRTSADAFYLATLVTAGYFDENGGLRDLYVDIRINDEYHGRDFQKELERLVDKKLLCVFVERDDLSDEVTTTVESRLQKFKNNEQIHDWLDIRGIGPKCGDTIDTVVETLEERYIGIDIDRWKNGDQMVVRIRPHTVGTINI